MATLGLKEMGKFLWQKASATGNFVIFYYMPFPLNIFFPAFPKEFSHFLQTIGSHSWVLLGVDAKPLFTEFGLLRTESLKLYEKQPKFFMSRSKGKTQIWLTETPHTCQRTQSLINNGFNCASNPFLRHSIVRVPRSKLLINVLFFR